LVPSFVSTILIGFTTGHLKLYVIGNSGRIPEFTLLLPYVELSVKFMWAFFRLNFGLFSGFGDVSRRYLLKYGVREEIQER